MCRAVQEARGTRRSLQSASRRQGVGLGSIVNYRVCVRLQAKASEGRLHLLDTLALDAGKTVRPGIPEGTSACSCTCWTRWRWVPGQTPRGRLGGCKPVMCVPWGVRRSEEAANGLAGTKPCCTTLLLWHGVIIGCVEQRQPPHSRMHAQGRRTWRP